MKIALIVSCVLIRLGLTAQATDTVPVIHKYDTVHLSKTCYLALQWAEINGRDTAVNRKINHQISEVVYAFSQWEHEDSAELCDSGITEVSNFSNYRTLFGKHNFVSCCISSSEPMEHDENGNLVGRPHTEFTTLNFNLKTGAMIKFDDLFEKQKIPAVDTLVMKGLMARLKGFDTDPQEWEAQLADLDFTMNDNGLDIYFRGSSYVLSIIDFIIPYNKLKPYAGKSGLLNLYFQPGQ